MIAINVEGKGGPANTFLQAKVKFLSKISLSFSSSHQVSLAKSISIYFSSKFEIKTMPVVINVLLECFFPEFIFLPSFCIY